MTKATIFIAALDKPTESKHAAFLQAVVARDPRDIWLHDDLGAAAWPSR